MFYQSKYYINGRWLLISLSISHSLFFIQETTIQGVLISDDKYSFVLMNYGIIAETSHPIQVRSIKTIWKKQKTCISVVLFQFRASTHKQVCNVENVNVILFDMCDSRLDMTQSILLTIWPSLDHSPIMLQAITQFSVTTLTSMYRAAGRFG